MRVGIGYDVHKLVKNEELIIGGVSIPFQLGLKGHSDADVLTHALIDALLGALGLGDIGDHFPDTNERFKDISSLVLLEKIARLMHDKGYKLGNADLVIIAEAPRLASYKDEMVENYKNLLNVKTSQINVKATTTEGLGFVGRKEGLAARVTVLLKEINS